MNDTNVCPSCHVIVRPTDYFCFNCGKNLKPTPPSVSLEAQLSLYTKSFLLPPFGILWGSKYLLQKDIKSKIVGLVAILITLIVFALAVKLFFDFTNSLNEQINEQMQGFGGF